MIKQITVDKTADPYIFAYQDAIQTCSTTQTDFVANELEMFNPSLISNAEIRLASGMFCVGGHYGYIPYGQTETCFVSPGNVGFKRKDLIVGRYTRVGTLDYCGIQIYTGVPTKTTPVAPTYAQENVLTGGKIREIPLFEVELLDMNVIDIKAVYPLMTKPSDVLALIKTSEYSVGSPYVQYHYVNEIAGVVTETITVTRPYTFPFNIDGVWKASSVLISSLTVEDGYYPTSIVAIPSVLSSAIIKAQITEVLWDSTTKKITFKAWPYAFIDIETSISATYSFYFRYTKVKA